MTHHDLPWEDNSSRVEPREWQVIDNEDGEVKGSFYSKKDAIYACGMLMFRTGKEMYIENINRSKEARARKLPSICRESISKLTETERFVLEKIVGEMEGLA